MLDKCVLMQERMSELLILFLKVLKPFYVKTGYIICKLTKKRAWHGFADRRRQENGEALWMTKESSV